MRSYPMFANLQGKLCVVVGGGHVAERKTASLLDSGARIKLVSPRCTEQFERWASHRDIELIRRRFEPQDVAEAALVLAATDDPETNLQVYRSIGPNQWINVADRPDLCTFTVPAIVERGKLQIAIGTGGRCPGLAKKLKGTVERAIGPEYEEYVDFVGAWRQRMIHLKLPASLKKQLLERLLDDSLLELTRSGKREARNQAAGRLLEAHRSAAQKTDAEEG
ncbi:bifunctional precorrin-2 dehydrogenase/sirohydrochlorin ferrochelatase [Paenibacillus sp. J2TS4]|uniref:precorrin-2 dehydrogenase/sirohydrochlorin ferrochelatase family protein n=1 Tax=Paenibacillus sp. J2TS4 TaxID=2807194 RepID=UPI001B1C558B|nr:bifunctional precorrin-2 dehydrogenase/sirohydrochlorin ferrochelatase [Paenibacillus sp. J2TS4]GIP35208.1 siroheme synthase [Paenibacillus sp. J2TS4]